MIDALILNEATTTSLRSSRLLWKTGLFLRPERWVGGCLCEKCQKEDPTLSRSHTGSYAVMPPRVSRVIRYVIGSINTSILLLFNYYYYHHHYHLYNLHTLLIYTSICSICI